MYNYLLKFELSDYFYSKDITVQKVTTFKTALGDNCEQLKAFNYYREVPHLSYGGFHGAVSDN